jgi:hypothetical protein
MAGNISTKGRQRRKSNWKSKQRNWLSLQKPTGVIGPRVKRVGGEKFAIVCVDPAKRYGRPTPGVVIFLNAQP